MDKKQYDAMVIFDTPIQIVDDGGDVISIYGLLYNQDEKHKDDLWTWELNRYICYLQGCERAQSNGCKLAPELLITKDENMIALKVRFKNLIYRIMKKHLIRYRMVELTDPIKIHFGETDDNLIISQQLINRIYNNEKKR